MVSSELIDAPVEPLSLGLIVDPSAENKPWREAIRALTIGVADALPDECLPLNLNVVFHVPGRQLKPDFTGVRTGAFSTKDQLLIVQVAVPEVASDDADAWLRNAVANAIEEAERWARRRRVPIDGEALRSIVNAASSEL